MSSPKIKRQPPSRDFDKYVATFQSDPLKKSIGLSAVNLGKWKQFGPILSSSSGYVEFTQESLTASIVNPGRNSNIIPLGFDFTFNGVTYRDFIASPHGWMSLLDPNNYPSTSFLDITYNDRMIVSGSSSYDNSAIKQAFQYSDLLLAPWFDRQLTTHKDLDSYIEYFSGSSDSISSQKERLLFGKSNSKDYSFNEHDFGMKYVLTDDSVNGKSLVVRWTTMGYEYRSKKLSYETAIYENGKIEFNYAPLGSYSTDYTLLGLSVDPTNVWKLDESSGSTVDDAMNNNDITYKTPVNMIPSAGKISTAAFFSGSNNTVIYANDSSFANYSVTNTFSFSAWFKSAVADSNNKPIVSRMDTSFAKGYILYLEGGYLSVKISQTFSGNTLRLRSALDTYNDGQWYHVAMTYDGSATAAGVKVYVDGQVISMSTVESTLSTGSDIQASGIRFCIGANGNDSTTQFNFSGTIDDVARWNSAIKSSDVSLIYDNGLSGVSAADIDLIGDSTTSYATCGIFASGSSTWNYRDFAPLLGVMSDSRKASDFGGALYTGSYLDVDAETGASASYTVNIGINHWPKHGGRITFSPPQRRRQLNKLDIYENDSKDFFGDSIFDDRKSIVYAVQDNVDASTTLPLSAIVTPSYPGVHLKQNLISSGGIKVSNRKVISAGHSMFMGDELENKQKLAPFSENSLHEQGRSSEEFFATGSVSYVGNWRRAFSRNLRNKKSIRLSFPVDRKTKMFTSGSSLYYYNITAGQWNIPTSSLIDHVSSSLQKLSVDTTGAAGTCNGSLYLEDKIGFDSQGNAIISGNLDIFRSTSGNTRNQSTAEIGTLFSIGNHASILTPEYPKSVQRNSSYNASNDEIFTLPIDDTFLIEKAVIEIPFCMGDGWFSDKTVFTFVSASNFAHTGSGGTTTALAPFSFLDEGGPAITVALFCQRNHGTGSVRDLVFKSTFTHTDDETKDVGFTYLGASGSIDLVHGVTLVGNENNSNIISDYVAYQTVNSKKQFTGSVLVKLDASITNCANIGTIKGIQTTNVSSSSILTSFDNFLSTEFVPANSITAGLDRLSYLLNFDSFGRSMSGFSAGSGGEYITTEGVLFGGSVRNPFYMSGSSQRQAVTASLESQISSLGTGSYVYCMSKIQLGGPKQLPYIARPGDKFVLAVSKTRPSFKNVDIRIGPESLSTGRIANVASSSYYNNISNLEGHDVVFNTGSINITLYGSNVKAGGEAP